MATRNEPPIHTAPEGIEAAWPRPPRRLHVILLADDLDEVTRRRYIHQAMAEHGLEPRRHGMLLLPLAGVHVSRPARVAATAATILTIGGISFAVIHDSYPTHDHRGGAAPAPRQSTPLSTVPKKPVPRPTAPSKTRPSHTPTARPSPAATTSLEPDVTAIASHLTPRLPLPGSLPVTAPPPLGGGHSIRPTVLPVPTRAPARVCVLRVHVDGARTVAVRLKVCLPG